MKFTALVALVLSGTAAGGASTEGTRVAQSRTFAECVASCDSSNFSCAQNCGLSGACVAQCTATAAACKRECSGTK
jgi:hypothetical protein